MHPVNTQTYWHIDSACLGGSLHISLSHHYHLSSLRCSIFTHTCSDTNNHLSASPFNLHPRMWSVQLDLTHTESPCQSAQSKHLYFCFTSHHTFFLFPPLSRSFVLLPIWCMWTKSFMVPAISPCHVANHSETVCFSGFTSYKFGIECITWHIVYIMTLWLQGLLMLSMSYSGSYAWFKECNIFSRHNLLCSASACDTSCAPPCPLWPHESTLCWFLKRYAHCV